MSRSGRDGTQGHDAQGEKQTDTESGQIATGWREGGRGDGPFRVAECSENRLR